MNEDHILQDIFGLLEIATDCIPAIDFNDSNNQGFPFYEIKYYMMNYADYREELSDDDIVNQTCESECIYESWSDKKSLYMDANFIGSSDWDELLPEHQERVIALR